MESVADEAREWLTAIGTVGAAGIAAYVGVLQAWRKKPLLSLDYDPHHSSDAVVVQVPFEERSYGTVTSKAAYARLRVGNAARKAPAEDVEVVVLRVTEVAPRPDHPAQGGDYALGDQPLPWSNSDPTTTRLIVMPGVERHVDLVHIFEASPSGKRPMILDVHPPPSVSRHAILSATLEIELVVTARNADARRYVVEVSYDGEWGDRPFDHLRVGRPRPLG